MTMEQSTQKYNNDNKSTHQSSSSKSIIRESRIPLGLQQVFLASNRGIHVDVPPVRPVFSRLWNNHKDKANNGSKKGSDKKRIAFGQDQVTRYDKHEAVSLCLNNQSRSRSTSNQPLATQEQNHCIMQSSSRCQRLSPLSAISSRWTTTQASTAATQGHCGGGGGGGGAAAALVAATTTTMTATMTAPRLPVRRSSSCGSSNDMSDAGANNDRQLEEETPTRIIPTTATTATDSLSDPPRLPHRWVSPVNEQQQEQQQQQQQQQQQGSDRKNALKKNTNVIRAVVPTLPCL